MHGFMEQRVERYVELANMPRSKVGAARTPRNLRDAHFEQPGEPSTIAAKVAQGYLVCCPNVQVRHAPVSNFGGNRGLPVGASLRQ